MDMYEYMKSMLSDGMSKEDVLSKIDDAWDKINAETEAKRKAEVVSAEKAIAVRKIFDAVDNYIKTFYDFDLDSMGMVDEDDFVDFMDDEIEKLIKLRTLKDKIDALAQKFADKVGVDDYDIKVTVSEDDDGQEITVTGSNSKNEGNCECKCAKDKAKSKKNDDCGPIEKFLRDFGLLD